MDAFDLPPARDFGGVVRRLVDPDLPPEAGLLTQLSGPGQADVALWRQVWPGIPDDRRRWLAEQLVASAEADFAVDYEPLLVVALDDPDPGVRAAAVDGLWESEDRHLAERFADLLLRDTDAAVRGRAATALATFALQAEMEEVPSDLAQRVVRVLLDAATDESEDVDVRRRATESVGYVDTAAVRALIDDHAAAGERQLRAGAVVAMGRSAHRRWEPLLLAYLEDRDPLLRFAAAHAAGDLGSRKSVPRLVSLAEGEDVEIQLEAIWALGEIGGQAARQALEGLAAAAEDEEVLAAVDDALATLALNAGDLDWTALRLEPAASGAAARPAAGPDGIDPEEADGWSGEAGDPWPADDGDGDDDEDDGLWDEDDDGDDDLWGEASAGVDDDPWEDDGDGIDDGDP